jgi:hypothetical protein
MAKIAKADNDAMNSLYAGELKKAGVKVASEEDPQAFEDHKEYLATLENVLADDKSESFDPNDEILD